MELACGECLEYIYIYMLFLHEISEGVDCAYFIVYTHRTSSAVRI